MHFQKSFDLITEMLRIFHVAHINDYRPRNHHFMIEIDSKILTCLYNYTNIRKKIQR